MPWFNGRPVTPGQLVALREITRDLQAPESARTALPRRRVRQDWTIGQTVSVGFLRDLTVVEKVLTPGDYAPDAYVLRRGDVYYRFVPHKGIERRQSLADARMA
jgi:hypothetical protein